MLVTTGSISSIQFFNKDVGRGSNKQDLFDVPMMILLTASMEIEVNVPNLLVQDLSMLTEMGVAVVWSRLYLMSLILPVKKIGKLIY